MKIPYHFQTISVGISLATLALGFSLIGLLSFIHEPHAGESIVASATTSAVGGIAGLAAGSIFTISAFFYWRRRGLKARVTIPSPSAVAST
jgi:hypothetical protein